jgi:hypothetical protein
MFGLKNKLVNKDQQIQPTINTSAALISIEKDISSLELYDYMKKKVVSNRELEIVVSPDCFSVIEF